MLEGRECKGLGDGIWQLREELCDQDVSGPGGLQTGQRMMSSQTPHAGGGSVWGQGRDRKESLGNGAVSGSALKKDFVVGDVTRGCSRLTAVPGGQLRRWTHQRGFGAEAGIVGERNYFGRSTEDKWVGGENGVRVNRTRKDPRPLFQFQGPHTLCHNHSALLCSVQKQHDESK